MSSILRQFLFRKLPQICNNGNNLRTSSVSPLIAAVRKYTHNLVRSDTTPYEVVDPKSEEKLTKLVSSEINNQVKNKKHGRLFAIVHVAGKQFKITEGDVIVIEGYWPPDVGDKITLDKVLLAGAEDFTLIGRPLVENGLIKVYATVIEKTLSHTKTHFRKKRRKQYMRIHFYRIPQTYLRINNINIEGELNNPPEVRGLETAIF